MLALVFIDPCEFVEVLDFSRDLHRKGTRIETGDAFDAARACQNGSAEGIPADAVGTDHAHSCDYHAAGHDRHCSCFHQCLRAAAVNLRPYNERSRCPSASISRSPSADRNAVFATLLPVCFPATRCRGMWTVSALTSQLQSST